MSVDTAVVAMMFFKHWLFCNAVILLLHHNILHGSVFIFQFVRFFVLFYENMFFFVLFKCVEQEPGIYAIFKIPGLSYRQINSLCLVLIRKCQWKDKIIETFLGTINCLQKRSQTQFKAKSFKECLKTRSRKN